MQQTILALGALMIIMVTALNHQRSILMIQEVSYVREMENAALDLAKSRAEAIISQTGFDEQWLGELNLPGSPSLLTPTNAFGIDSNGLIDDVDDVHDTTELNIPHVIGVDTFRFNISFSVSYINDYGNPTNARTFAKQLTASVVSTDSIGVRVARASFNKTTIISEDL